jgi:hypothetical protein
MSEFYETVAKSCTIIWYVRHVWEPTNAHANCSHSTIPCIVKVRLRYLSGKYDLIFDVMNTQCKLKITFGTPTEKRVSRSINRQANWETCFTCNLSARQLRNAFNLSAANWEMRFAFDQPARQLRNAFRVQSIGKPNEKRVSRSIYRHANCETRFAIN